MKGGREEGGNVWEIERRERERKERGEMKGEGGREEVMEGQVIYEDCVNDCWYLL